MEERRNFKYFFFFVGLEYLNKKYSSQLLYMCHGTVVQMAMPHESFPTIFSMCLHLFENEHANMGLFMNQMLNLFSHPVILYVVFQLANRCRLLNLSFFFLYFLFYFCTFSCCRVTKNKHLHLMKGFLVPGPLTVWPLGVCIKRISIFFFIASWKYIQLTCELNYPLIYSNCY